MNDTSTDTTPNGPEQALRREFRDGWDAGALYTLAILANRAYEEETKAGEPEQREAWDRVRGLVREWMAGAPSAAKAAQFGPAVRYLGDDLAQVSFVWATDHGACFTCPAPAAFYVYPYDDAVGVSAYGRCERACARCAAGLGADGVTVRWIKDPSR